MPRKKTKTPKDNLNSIWKINSDLPKRRHEAGTPVVVIFDGMNFAHAAFHAYKKLSYKGKSTSILFGMPTMIRSILTQNQWAVDKIIIAWDGDKDPRRMEWLPTYKSHREVERNENPEARKKFLKQCAKVRKLFYYLGVPQAYDKTIEGDDMIYHLVKRYKTTNKVIIVSGDEDMLQMVDYDVSVFNQRNNALWWPEGISMAHSGLSVSQVFDLKILCGDDSDDIPGVRGIAKARGTKFLKEFKSIKKYLADENAEFAGMIDKDKIAKVCKLGKRMMDLKWFNNKFHKGYEPLFWKDALFPKFNKIAFTNLCSKYNMRTFLTSTFQEFFKKYTE